LGFRLGRIQNLRRIAITAHGFQIKFTDESIIEIWAKEPVSSTKVEVIATLPAAAFIPKVERSPFESWHTDAETHFVPTASSALESQWLSAFPGIQMGIGCWYGSQDLSMASIAFRRGNEIAYLDQRYASLERWLLNQPKDGITIAHD
jgi:hypothetical protein